ncbi:hypothetical protein ACFZBE_41290 [Streptomyces sp. NPDC008061]|uniref:hypothetical protein n=1 Tax=Streptomyces sp. NPDC008061 TaxID=3364805 RepID=UPI0036E7A35A
MPATDGRTGTGTHVTFQPGGTSWSAIRTSDGLAPARVAEHTHRALNRHRLPDRLGHRPHRRRPHQPRTRRQRHTHHRTALPHRHARDRRRRRVRQPSRRRLRRATLPRTGQSKVSQRLPQKKTVVGRGHVEELPDGTSVRLGVFLSNQKTRRDRLAEDQLAQLATLGLAWAQ